LSPNPTLPPARSAYSQRKNKAKRSAGLHFAAFPWKLPGVDVTIRLTPRSTLAGIPPMSTNTSRYETHYTVADYELWEGDWELWDGIAVSMSPSPTPLHQFIATSLAAEIRHELRRQSDRCRCLVVTETDWHIGKQSVLRPDVSVLCSGMPLQHIDYAPTLIAEVLSPSTQHKDRTAKRDLYAQQQVDFYLIVDPETRSVEVLHLQEGTYVRLPTDENNCARLALHEECVIRLHLPDIFPPLEGSSPATSS
ncbi:MAG: Uma2 family endonuclease, partial [Planctomycetaceae bacterium]|nr:Uma2 family endonuclease [Planctomycetaceae bacterium]